MKISRELSAFCDRIGYQFSDPTVLIHAVTHASVASPLGHNNERLEFLGDRVLGLVMAEALLQEDRGAREGQLAPRFNALVRKEACADVAREYGLGEVLKLGRSEMVSGGRRKDALLGDAMEAVIAAIYWDAGFDVARDTVRRLWGKRITEVEADARDPKTALQELVQAEGSQPPEYVVVKRDGPDHAPIFTIEARLKSGVSATAQAGSKRQAEHAAAKELLERLST